MNSGGSNSVSIVRIGLAETKNFADGYDAIFAGKKPAGGKAKPKKAKAAKPKATAAAKTTAKKKAPAKKKAAK